MKKIIAAALAVLPFPALAQQSDAPASAPAASAPPPWSAELDFSASPRFGRAQAFDASQDLVDESELEVNFAVRRPRIVWRLPLEVKIGVTSSPQILDDQDEKSSFYAQATLGDAWFTLPELVARGADESAAVAEAFEDAVRPYARYRFTRFYSGLIDTYGRNEHQITGGVRWRNVISVMCDEPRRPPRATEEYCSNDPGVSFEARAEGSRIWSSDPLEERYAALLRLELISRRLAGGVRLFGRAAGDAAFYDHAVVPLTGENREDWRLRLTAGIDLAGLWSERLPGLRLELAGQFQQRWSNDAAREHARFYFVPTIGYRHNF